MAETDHTPDQPSDQPPAGKDGDPEVARLQAEIEETREQLGATVDALGQKLDVKTRVRDSVTTDDGGLRREVQAAGAALVVVVVLVVWRKRRKG